MPAVLLDKLLAGLDVEVEPFSLCEVSPQRRLNLPECERVMLHFVLRGSGFVRSAAATAHTLAPCTLAVVPKRTRHALEPGGEVVAECAVDPGSVTVPSVPVISTESTAPPEMIVICGWIDVRLGAVVGLFDELKDVLVEDLSGTPQAVSAFEQILAEQTRSGPGSEALIEALMSQCIVYLLRRLCKSGTCTLPWLAALEDERLARALDYMFERPADRHTVESLADVAAMSRSSFAQAFVEAFGLPPMTLLRRLRLERARKLLERPGAMPVQAVARRVGFSSRSHFSREFKRYFGVSPVARRAVAS